MRGALRATDPAVVTDQPLPLKREIAELTATGTVGWSRASVREVVSVHDQSPTVILFISATSSA